MTHQNTTSSTSFKLILYLLAGVFAVAALLLIIWSTLAAAPEGATPTSATTLVDDVTKGKLTPGEQHWFKFTPDPEGQVIDVEKSLTLIFTPDNGYNNEFIGFKIFEESEIQFYFKGDTSKMTHLGTGNMVSRDGNPVTGEYLWHGWVFGPKTYYVYVFNDSDFTIDYWLFNDDVRGYALGEPAAPAPAAVAAETTDSRQLGLTPNSPEPLTPGLTRSKLASNSTHWYSFSYPDLTGWERHKEIDFSMFTTPDNGDRRYHVTFEIFSLQALEQWQRGEADKFANFGAGGYVDRDGDDNTIEHVWHGFVNTNETYLLAVRNGSDTEIEYWLYDEDLRNPELGPKREPDPGPVFAPGAAPDSARPLQIGLNKGRLAPGEERWYSFSRTDSDPKTFEEMALTMVTTPNDNNYLRHMVFKVFTKEGVRAWDPADDTKIQHFGAGSIVEHDKNPLTGERFWYGWVLDEAKYFVQVRNGADVPLDYWLFTGDVRQPELGPPIEAKPPVQAPPGLAPSNPIELEVKITDGSLRPGEERWYVFSRGDVDETGGIETTLTMVFTPDDGDLIRRIAFEFFEEEALREWAPDNRDNIISFGQGNVVDRDGNPLTGEFLWNGYVLAHKPYYLRIKNGSDTTINYRLYPEDIINTNLGE